MNTVYYYYIRLWSRRCTLVEESSFEGLLVRTSPRDARCRNGVSWKKTLTQKILLDTDKDGILLYYFAMSEREHPV